MVRDRRARRRTDMLGVALAMHTVPSDARLVGRRGRRLVDGDVVVHPPPCEIKLPAYGFVLTNSVARGVISRHPIWDGLGTGGVLLLFAQLETSPLGSVCIRFNDLSLRRRTSLPRTKLGYLPLCRSEATLYILDDQVLATHVDHAGCFSGEACTAFLLSSCMASRSSSPSSPRALAALYIERSETCSPLSILTNVGIER